MYGVGFGYGAIGATTVLSGGGSAYDADAQSFFSANSTLTDVTQKNAINQFYVDLKANSLYSKMRAMYFMFLGDATKNSYNGVNPAAYQLSFSSGWTHSSSGATPNGTSAYASTGIKVSDFTNSSIGMGVYLRTNTDGLFCDIGTIDSLRFQLLSSFIGYHYCALPDINVLQNGVAANSLGLLSLNRYSTSNRKTYQKGILKHTATESMSSTPSNYDFKIGASGGSSITWYSPRQNAFTCFKNAMSDNDEANLNTCVNTLMTTLGINV